MKNASSTCQNTLKNVKQTDLDLAYQKEMAAIGASTYEPPTILCCLWVLVFCLICCFTALIVSGQNEQSVSQRTLTAAEAIQKKHLYLFFVSMV